MAYEDTDAKRMLTLARHAVRGAEIIASKYEKLEAGSRLLLKRLVS